MRNEVLRMERVTYTERGAMQLEDFNLTLFSGEIVGLMPINSHGLTALINLLRNNLPLQYGYVYYRDEPLNSWRAPHPQHNRIGVIQSEGSLVDGLTVADNIFVLRPSFKTWYLRPAVLRRQLAPFLEHIGIALSADAYVDTLTTFQRFVVELLKAVVAGSRLVLLRDVSTFISETELAQLHAILRHYAAQGMTFLYIGFHFEELEQICCRTALLANGRIAKVLRREEMQTHALDFYDRSTWEQQLTHHISKGTTGTPALAVTHLSGGAVHDLSFTVGSGECLVLQDLDNHIFGDLLALLQGELPIKSGAIHLRGTPLAPAPTRALAIVREQPADTMIFPEMSYFDNLYFTVDHRLPELWRSHRMQEGLRREAGAQGNTLFGTRPEHLTKTQKYDLVYRRILLQNPAAVLCIQPFKGADFALRMHVWSLLESLLQRGVGVVILAVNLADSLSLATRLIRIRKDAPIEIYEQRDFAKIPFSAPWRELYRRRQERE